MSIASSSMLETVSDILGLSCVIVEQDSPGNVWKLVI
jgi:hypothetical protein